MIRAEADLARFTPEEEIVAVRMIHAAGMVELAPHIRFTPGMAIAARAALEAARRSSAMRAWSARGSPASACPPGTRSSAPCTTRVPALAARWATPARPRRWSFGGPHLEGAVVAIGNAPTALFHLLNMLEDPACPRPAAIIGCPVGFVGAAESKDALMAAPPVPSVIVARDGLAGRRSRWLRQRAGQPEGMTHGSQKNGKVICAGLGPGDPDLMSLRAARAIGAGETRGLFPQGGPRRAGAADRRGDAVARCGRIPDGIPGDDRAAL
jgi:precorrin-8X/cobalt-precorrin-8 methylmutase